MLLTDLRNKEQEHKEIKKLLKEYGYTVKPPVYGNSAKKALQQIKDAKQDLYRDFSIEEYNRVILLEKYLEQLIERPLMEQLPIGMTAEMAAELMSKGVDPHTGRPLGPNRVRYLFQIHPKIAEILNRKPTTTITIKSTEANRKIALQAIREAEEREARDLLVKKLAKEVGDKSAWQITKILMAKIGARHAIASGASIWTGPGVIAVNAGLLTWDAWEIYKLAKLIIKVRKLSKLRNIDKAVDAVDTAADVATTASTATKVAASLTTAAAVGTVVVPSLGMYPNLNEIHDIPEKERKLIEQVNKDVDKIIEEGSSSDRDIDTNHDVIDIIKKENWEGEPGSDVTHVLDIGKVHDFPVITNSDIQRMQENTYVTWNQFAEGVKEFTDHDIIKDKHLNDAAEQAKKAADKAELDRLDDIEDAEAEQRASEFADTAKELPAPEETTTPPIILEIPQSDWFEITEGTEDLDEITRVLERHPEGVPIPANVELITTDTGDREHERSGRTDREGNPFDIDPDTEISDTAGLVDYLTKARTDIQQAAADELEAGEQSKTIQGIELPKDTSLLTKGEQNLIAIQQAAKAADAEVADNVIKWEPTLLLPAPVKIPTPHGWRWEIPKSEPETDTGTDTGTETGTEWKAHTWRYNALQQLRRQRNEAEAERDRQVAAAINAIKNADTKYDAGKDEDNMIDLRKAVSNIDPDAFVSQQGVEVPIDLTKAVEHMVKQGVDMDADYTAAQQAQLARDVAATTNAIKNANINWDSGTEDDNIIDLTKAVEKLPKTWPSQQGIKVPKTEIIIKPWRFELPEPVTEPGTDLTKAVDKLPKTYPSQQGIKVPKKAIDLRKAADAIDPDAYVSQKGIEVPKKAIDLKPAVDKLPIAHPSQQGIKVPKPKPITRKDLDRHPEKINWQERQREREREKELERLRKQEIIKKRQQADKQKIILPNQNPALGMTPKIDALTKAVPIQGARIRQGGRPGNINKRGKMAKPWGIPFGLPGIPGGTSGKRDVSEPPLQTYLSLGPRLKRDSGWVGGVINSSIIRRGNVMNEEATFKNLKKLLEQDLDQAELALAAKDMVVQLQDIAEDLAKMQVENLMPLVDRIKEEYGPEAGEQFNGSVEAALGSALEGIKGTHEQVQDAVLVLTGEKSAMSTDMGSDDMSMDMGDTDMDDGLGGDDEISLDGAEAAAGPADVSLGRAVKKESVEKAKRALQTALKEGKYNDKVLRQIIQSMK